MKKLPYPTGEQLKRRGCKRVCDHNAAWVEKFHDAAQEIYDFWGNVGSQSVIGKIGMPPGHPSAVGGAMRAFALEHQLRIISFGKSRRPSRHAGMVAMWGPADKLR